jgi:hypothetical protein
MNFALALSMLLAHPSSARDDLITPDPGTKAFRSILAGAGLLPIENYDDLLIESNKKVLIIFGDITEARHRLFSNGVFAQFLKNGGAVLIATDDATETDTRPSLKVWVDGPLLEGGNNTTCYRREVHCPFLQKPAASAYELPNQPELGRVATNNPSRLHSEPGAQLLYIADLPNDSRRVQIEHGIPMPIGRQQLPIHFAAGRELGRARFIVMADHSLFINTMLLQPDNENFEFASATVKWLTENGKRNKALFLDDGNIRTSFELFPLNIDDRLPHPDILMPAVDQMIIDLEKDNAFNRAIHRFASPQQIFRTFLLLLTVGLAAWGLYRITAGRLRLSTTTERLPDRVETLADPATASERRLRDRSQGDVSPLATELARQFFDENSIDVGSLVQPEASASSLLARRHWRRKVTWLWSVAQAEHPSPWPAERLPHLVQELDAARSAIAAGQLQIRAVEHSA